MRFAFVHGEKAHHAVRRLCSVLQVTPSGYYAWAHRGPSAQQRDNDRLKVRIRAIHTASRGTYGSPRIHEQLRQDGVPVGRARVAPTAAGHGADRPAPQAAPVHDGQ